MKRLLQWNLLILFISLLFVSSSSWAQEEEPTKEEHKPRLKRWELEFTNKTPELFTCADPLGKKKNYWYMVYTLTNNTDKDIGLSIDICIKTDRGKYHQDTYHPLITDEIIMQEEKLTGLALGLRKERVEELKKASRYLDCKELRERGKIRPEETLGCVAVFKALDPRTRQIEVMVGGLFDVVKHKFESPPAEGGTLEEKTIYEYECRIWKITYHCWGDEFQPHLKSLQKGKKEWVIRNYGPIGDKETLHHLIEALEDKNPLIHWAAWWLLRRMTDETFEYNPAKEPEENKKAITRWKEWWFRNSDKLIYDMTLNKFKIKEPK